MADCPERKPERKRTPCCGRPERENASESWARVRRGAVRDATLRRLDAAVPAREVGFNEDLKHWIMRIRHLEQAKDAGIDPSLLKNKPGDRVKLKDLVDDRVYCATKLHKVPNDIRNGDSGIIMAFNFHDRCLIDASPVNLVKIKLDRLVDEGNQHDSSWRTHAKEVGSLQRPIASSDCYPGSAEEKRSEIFEKAHFIYGNEILDNIIIVPEINVEFEEHWTPPKSGSSKRRKRRSNKTKKTKRSKKSKRSKSSKKTKRSKRRSKIK